MINEKTLLLVVLIAVGIYFFASKPSGECSNASHCEGMAHIAGVGYWECINSTCIWQLEAYNVPDSQVSWVAYLELGGVYKTSVCQKKYIYGDASRLSFYMQKYGDLSEWDDSLVFRIKNLDGSEVAYSAGGDPNIDDIDGWVTIYLLTIIDGNYEFATYSLNGWYLICADYEGGDSNNWLKIFYESEVDVKGEEYLLWYKGGEWTERTQFDLAYIIE